jgi:hypothetical protein
LHLIPIFAGMLPDKTANPRLTALNSAYLLTGALGFLYFIYGFLLLREPTTAPKTTSPEVLQSHHLLLLFTCLLELAIGLFIRQATKQAFLFAQSLATMLVITGHGLLIYHFHTESTAGNLPGNLIPWATGVLGVAMLLHLFARLENSFTKVKH